MKFPVNNKQISILVVCGVNPGTILERVGSWELGVGSNKWGVAELMYDMAIEIQKHYSKQDGIFSYI
jgi:hypothetical protein